MRKTLSKWLKRSAAFAIVLSLLVSVGGIKADAASYPTLIPKEFQMECDAGADVAIVYSYFPSYKNEQINITIYDPTGAKVATSNKSFTHSYTTSIEYTVNWTAPVDVGGQYKIVAVKKYYSVGAWHTAPSDTVSYINVKGDPNAEGGHSFEDAKVASFDTTYTRVWTKNTYDKNTFVQFTMPSRGFITFDVEKPMDDDYEYCDFTFKLHDGDTKAKIWESDCDWMKDDGKSSYVYRVGLDAGTYYLNIMPGFRVSSGHISADYSLMFTPDEYSEIEPNNAKSTATEMVVNETYSGIWGEEYSTASDNWKVYLEAGKNYTLYLGNNERVGEGTTILEFTGPNNQNYYQVKADLMDFGYAEFTPKYTGYHYFKLYNENREMIYYELGVEVDKGTWRHNATGWWYSFSDGSYYKNCKAEIDGKTYFFNKNGYMVTGWNLENGKWYFYNSSGAMQKGWIYVGGKYYYMNNNGAMTTGWQLVGGKWYYMGTNGVMTTGWQYVGGKYYYMNSSGAMTTGWQLVGGKWYYMSGSGIMQTGWIQSGGAWYYMESSGAMATNKWIGNYYVLGNGKMATDQWIGNYYVNASGVWVPGAVK